jgi:hypothetical protein
MLRTWRQLTQLPDERRASVDIAEVQLACATGLPGAEHVDGLAVSRRLDRWACQVRKSTQRLESHFESNPDAFHGSHACFRMAALTTVLQRDLGVRPTEKLNGPNPDLSDSRDLFLHGPLDGRPGTCSSLPPLYAAVGRRLGYPLRLVSSPFHLFLRWDDGEERFNVECTSLGFFTPDDNY